MRGLITKGRFTREEEGFTLIEMTVTITLWIAILFALLASST